jgi:hypothetical protein
MTSGSGMGPGGVLLLGGGAEMAGAGGGAAGAYPLGQFPRLGQPLPPLTPTHLPPPKKPGEGRVAFFRAAAYDASHIDTSRRVTFRLHFAGSVVTLPGILYMLRFALGF